MAINTQFNMPSDLIDHWRSNDLSVDLQHQTITREGIVTKLEPMVMELFQLLIKQPNQVISKTTIMDQLWPGKFVNDEALTKLVSKLRKALGDDPKNPAYIKTVPKKGYSLLYQPAHRKKNNHSRTWVLLIPLATIVVLVLTFDSSDNSQPTDNLQQMYDRAESHYYQYTRLENESALKLYEKIIAADPEHALSQSGLANALVQKTLRWPNAINEPEISHNSLTESLAAGRLKNEQATLQLARAEGLALRATVLAPDNAKAHRSLGLVYAAQEKFAQAEKQYRQAIALDHNEWGALINLSELQSHAGDPTAALSSLKQAHAAMSRVYTADEVIIRPWYAKLGVVIADKSFELAQFSEAEIWYRQVLDFDPYNEAATMGLIKVLQQQGDQESANSLCFDLRQKVNPDVDC